LRKLIAEAALLLMVSALASAQNADYQPRGVGYVFAGGGTHSMGLTAGFGGEAYIAKGLGLGAEVAAGGLTTTDNYGQSNMTGLGSADVSYHFFPKKIQGNASPFVAGGYTLFFGHNAVDRGKDVTTDGFNVGGGVDLFGAKHVGVRFDVRYYGHGGRILRFTYPNLAEFSFVAFRFGLTFR